MQSIELLVAANVIKFQSLSVRPAFPGSGELSDTAAVHLLATPLRDTATQSVQAQAALSHDITHADVAGWRGMGDN